jgi:hypothetical protein
MNTSNTYSLPEQYHIKNKPVNLVGSNLRLSYLLANYEQYIDQVVTVVGWAR